MTAKEYFRQAYRLNQRINSDIAEVDQLRMMATNITSSALDEKVKRSRNGDAPFVSAIEPAGQRPGVTCAKKAKSKG